MYCADGLFCEILKCEYLWIITSLKRYFASADISRSETRKLWPLMAGFDSHSFCTRCRDKGKGPDSCISKSDCNSCNVLTSDQHLQLSIPSYKLKKVNQRNLVILLLKVWTQTVPPRGLRLSFCSGGSGRPGDATASWFKFQQHCKEEKGHF